MAAWVITGALERATVAMERASEALEGVMVAWATMEALEEATVALDTATVALGTAMVALGTATAALGTATAVTTMATAAMTMATVATTMATVATTRATVATRTMEVLEDMERGTEGLDFHLMASEEDMEGLEVHLMALEEVMVELAPTPMVVQVPYMECQDMVGRGDTTHRLQPMVPNRLQPMVPNLLLVIHNLLLMMHLVLHNHLQPMEVLQLAQGRLMTHLPRPMRPLPTIFLLAMVFDLPQTNLGSNSLVPSSNLEPTNSLLHRLLLAQCDV